jgi:hypothetical protein
MSWITALFFFFLGVVVAMMIHTTTYDMCQDFMSQKMDHLVRVMNQWAIDRDRSSPPAETPTGHDNNDTSSPTTY